MENTCPSATPVGEPKRTAVLIACKNGEAMIGSVVRSASAQADVFVVSDGSTDRTVAEARLAGAAVLSREVSSGKPAALGAAVEHFRITARYDYVLVVDDDATISADYVERFTRRMDACLSPAAPVQGVPRQL